MKTNTAYFFIPAAIFLCSIASGQNLSGRLLYRLEQTNAGIDVELKWFHNRIVKFDEGCNIYYRTSASGNWQKINDTLVKPEEEIGAALLKEDSVNSYYVDIFQGEDKAGFDPLIMVTLFSKSFQSNRYSRFLGNYYHFSLPVQPENIQFLVKYFRFGQERELAQTGMISLPSLSKEIQSFDVEYKEQKGKIQFSWRPDDDVFFGVNVYRKDLDKPGKQNVFRKVNTYPVVPGFLEDEDGALKLPEYLFEDTVSEKSRYEYKLEAIGYFENKVAGSKTIEIATKDYTPPPRAFALERTVQGRNTVTLTWLKPGTDDYSELYVMRSSFSEGPYERLNKRSLIKGTVNYVDEPAPGKGYYYYILTRDDAGNENKSNTVFIDIPDVTPPSPPQDVLIKADTGRIRLSWSANMENDLRGYRVFRGVENETFNNFILLNANPIAELQFSDSLPKNASNKFLYYVVAVDSALNNSDPSKVVSAFLPDVTPPTAPFLYEVSSEGNGVLLKWKPSVEDDVAGYSVYRGQVNKEDSIEVQIATVEHDKISFVDEDSEPGQVYYYFLTAEDLNKNSSKKTNSITIKYQRAFPEDGVTFSGKYVPETKKVVFELPENDDYVGEIMYRKGGSEALFEQISGNLNDKFFEDSDVVPNGTYTYKLTVFFKNGKKRESNELTISTH